MAPSKEPLRLEQGDLFSPHVEAYLEERAALKRAMPDIEPQPLIIRILYSAYFYLSMACMIGALIGWMILEPFFDDVALSQHDGGHVAAFLLFPTVAAFIGLFLGAVEGIMC